LKDTIIVITSTIGFFILLLSILIGVQKNIFRIPVYFNPDGLVLNINSEYKEYWGHRLSVEDVEFAKELNTHFSFAEHEVRIYDKFENIQIGKFFFVNIKKTKIIIDFATDISISLISFVVAVWFFYYIRDFYIFFFFLGLSFTVLFNFLYLAFDSFRFFLIFFLYLTSFMLFNLSFRFRGKEVKLKWIIPQIILTALAAFVAQTESDNPKIILQLGSTGLILVLFSSSLTSASILYDIFRYDQPIFTIGRKLSLLFSMLVVMLVPITLLFYDPLSILQFPRVFILFPFLLFLACFIYGTYRYSLIPAQIFFNQTIITIILVGFIVGLYVILLYFASFVKSHSLIFTPKYFNILFLLTIVVYLISIKSWIRKVVDYYTFRRNKKLSRSIEKISNLISSPLSMKRVVGALNKDMKDVLNVTKIILLFPGDLFLGFDLRTINITRISKNSEIWKFFENSMEVTVTSHLAYGVGFRETLHNYLAAMGIQIAYPIKDLQHKFKNKAILLIGEKVDKQNFSIGELRYIREVGRLASMLIDNYSLLAEDIEKKKILRSLNIASVLDHTLNLIDDLNNPKLNYGYISIPAVEVSGDYLDLIEVNMDTIAIFIGDVSGHGLGTGYIVTAIKAIIRDMIRDGESLENIFSAVNFYLKEKYGGDDFMTMLGGFLNLETGNFDFINAGHPGWIQIRRNGEFVHHNKTQRVLGILNTEYTRQTVCVQEGDKIILYSDGVTDTFSPSDKIFGEEGLIEFLKKNFKNSPQIIPYQLKDALQEFRSGKEPSDDATFVCIGIVSGNRDTDK